MRRSQQVALAGATAAVALASWAVVRGLRPQHAAISKLDDRARHKADILQRWRAMPYETLAPDQRPAIERAVRLSLPGLAEITPQSRQDGLVAILVDSLIARASPDPSAYLALASGDRTARWTTPADRDWERLRVWYDSKGLELSQDNLPVALRHYIEDEAAKGNTLNGVAADPRGGRLLAYRVHSADQVDYELISRTSPADMDYWFTNEGHSSSRFRLPVRSLDDVLDAEGFADIVDVGLLVRSSNDPYHLHTTWYWDPSLRAWMNLRVVRKGWHAFVWY